MTTCPTHHQPLVHLTAHQNGTATRRFACGCEQVGWPPPEALDLFLVACQGAGAPGEPTPLDALDSLLADLSAVLNGQNSEGGLRRQNVATAERLARELRQAVGKAEGA